MEDAELATKIKDKAEKALAAEGYSVDLQVKNEYAEGYKASKHAFEIWLAPLPHVTPVVNLKVEAGTEPGQVEKLRKGLVDAGYQVPPPTVKNDTTVPKQDVRVLYYKKSDADEANSLLKTVRGLGASTSKATATQANDPSASTPRRYDVQVTKESFTAEPSP